MTILRDQFLDYMSGPCAGRPLFAELFGPLVGLETEWLAQGAGEDEITLRAFGFDTWRRHVVNVSTGPLNSFSNDVIEDSPGHRITRDVYGRRMMLCKNAATIPLPLDHPVSDMDSWLRVKPWYAWNEARLGANWLAKAKQALSGGATLALTMPGGFDEPRQLLGEEGVCIACYEEPEMLHDMLNAIGSMVERVFDTVTREIPVDVVFVHEDMAGKSGPLLGPSLVTEFIKPYYRRCWDLVASRGARIFQQDSDGNMTAVIDAFLDAGINSMYPMEPAAGMDIVEVRKKYGTRLSLMGGIDKHVLRQGRDAIRRELEHKLQPMMRGATVFGLDHRIPNGTPIASYRYYVKTAREMLGLDPNPAPSWERFSF